MIVNGVVVTRKDDVISFEYKNVPVSITVVSWISDKDIIELVENEMVDMDILFQDL